MANIFDFLSKPFQPEEKEEDPGFAKWYGEIVKGSDISPDPDDPKHYYDYRSAYNAGADPDGDMHLPSEFKHDLHPNRYVVGKNLEIMDSKYNKPAKLEEMIMQVFQRKEHEESLWK